MSSELRPSSALCDYEIGDLFRFEDGHKYILLKRDIMKCTVARWYWYDNVIVKLYKLFRRGNNVRRNQ
jgi:hypothetical protein